MKIAILFIITITLLWNLFLKNMQPTLNQERNPGKRKKIFTMKNSNIGNGKTIIKRKNHHIGNSFVV